MDSTVLLEQIQSTSGLEWIAVICGVTYVILAGKQMRSCWYFAMISTGIFIFLCFQSKLYIESSLQMFYFGMAIYGWLSWKKQNQAEIPIIRWKWTWHFWNILISAFVAFILGFSLSKWTDQANSYLDAFTTVYSLLATWMVAKKVLENWIYWIIIDVALFYLYGQNGLYLTSYQYLFFTLLAAYAYFNWYKSYQTQKV